jgi:HK97 family phage major capsid protein
MTRSNLFAGAALLGPMSAAERSRGRYMRDGTGHADFNIKTWVDGVEAKLKEHGVSTTEIGTLKEQVAQIEQKMAKGGGGGGFARPPVSLGGQLIDSAEFKNYMQGGGRGQVKMALKAITAAQAGTAWSDRDNDVASMAKRGFVVRDLLNVVPTSASSVDWVKQTTRTNAAAPVAEGAQKPYSAYIWTPQNTVMRTLAHLAKITRQALDDAPTLQAEVDSEMTYGLGYIEDSQLLLGDGTGQNLSGLVPAATAYAAPVVIAGATHIDQIGLAVLQVGLTEFAADGIVLHPTDWMGMRLTKDGQGNYIFGPPNSPLAPQLFGLPVAVTQAISVGHFLVGGFKLQKLYDRMAPEVLIASENVDDFEHNLYTMRCEERLALAIRQPTALVYGTFN